MKRSEVLLLIQEMLLESDNFERGGAPELAEEFLDFILEIGMLPPINNHSFYMDGDSADVNNVIYREWEREDV